MRGVLPMRLGRWAQPGWGEGGVPGQGVEWKYSHQLYFPDKKTKAREVEIGGFGRNQGPGMG